MTSRTAEASPQLHARVAGLLYLIIFLAGLFTQFFVLFSLIVPEDAASTADNLNPAAGPTCCRAGIILR